MKLLIAMVISMTIIFFASISISDTDILYGLWSNRVYYDNNIPQKIEFNYDGTYATYKYSMDMETSSRGMYQITKKWSDSKGHIWYEIVITDLKTGKIYQLTKVDKNGGKLESNSDKDNYPSKLDPDEKGYRIYWRAKYGYERSPDPPDIVID
jgi:hypothetical protein